MTIPANSPMCRVQLWRGEYYIFEVAKVTPASAAHVSIREQIQELVIGFAAAKPVVDWMEDQCRLQDIDPELFFTQVERGFSSMYSTEHDDMFIYSAEIPLPLANMMKLRWHGVEGFQVLIQ